MAMRSGIYGKTLLDQLAGDGTLDLSGTPDTIDFQFVTDAEVPDYDNASPDETDITTEGSAVTTAGTYTTGGEPLTTPTLTLSTTHVYFDEGGSDPSLTGTTIDAEGVIGFDDTVTTPIADPLLWGTDFGSTYSTSNGTFAITWDANGIFRFSLT